MSTQTVTRRAAASGAAAKASAPTLPPKTSRGGVTVNRVPAAKPSFTLGDIRRAIPAHCFTRPLSKSFSYLFVDLFVAGVLYYATSFIPAVSDELVGASLGPLLRGLLWVAYWVSQGAVCTGLWVIGHECGHRGFADSDLVNDAVGLVVHSFLLVPYFSWQLSHKRHHSNTGSVEHDEVFVPTLASKDQIASMKAKDAKAAATGHHEHEEESMLEQLGGSLHRLFFMVVMFTLGWPAYLAANVTGNKSYDVKRWVNHFQPSSPIYTNGQETDALHQKLVVISDVALLAVFAVLYKFVQLTSLSHVVFTYFIPYLIVNFWLVLITYLQHTDLNLPHYTDGEWDWLRGALATIDRDYGFLNVVMHHITDTHVVHHLFSTMPHYHAEEATAAVKGLLGEYYRYDNTPVFTALWNSYRDCQVLYPDDSMKGVHWFEPKL